MGTEGQGLWEALWLTAGVCLSGDLLSLIPSRSDLCGEILVPYLSQQRDPDELVHQPSFPDY